MDWAKDKFYEVGGKLWNGIGCVNNFLNGIETCPTPAPPRNYPGQNLGAKSGAEVSSGPEASAGIFILGMVVSLGVIGILVYCLCFYKGFLCSGKSIFGGDGGGGPGSPKKDAALLKKLKSGSGKGKGKSTTGGAAGGDTSSSKAKDGSSKTGASSGTAA